MYWRSGISAALVLALASPCVWSLDDPERLSVPADRKLVIGAVSAVPHPAGFVVEDRRSGDLKVSARRQTYQRPVRFFSSNRGPLAKYETTIGDDALNVSPIDFLAEQMILRYGEKLNGRRLVVHRFSMTVKESIDKPQGVMLIPLDAASVGVAIISSLAGTALIQGLDSGRSLELEVKLEAELDGRRFTGSDFGSVFLGRADGRAEKITAQVLKTGFYNLDQAEAEEKNAPKPDSAEPLPQTEASVVQ